MTFGAAFRLIKGGVKAGRGIVGKMKGEKDKKSGDDNSDKYSEEGSSDSSESEGGRK